MESSEIDLSEFNEELNDGGASGDASGRDAQPSPAPSESASANPGEISN